MSKIKRVSTIDLIRDGIIIANSPKCLIYKLTDVKTTYYSSRTYYYLCERHGSKIRIIKRLTSNDYILELNNIIRENEH